MRSKNRKTVRKPFSYLQCDDFAAYLSDMAAKGWHFKEWGAGLVFEKGEPEQAVYAVEVFIHGSQYDLKPDEHTMNFSDYCEAAGWKLIDSKQKYCIFKQIQPDAVPIVTPEERLKNASKAYRGQLIWQVVLAFLFMLNLMLHVLPTGRLIDTLFSGVDLVLILFWVIYFLFAVGKCVWYAFWVQKAKKRCEKGESKLLSQSNRTASTWFSILTIVALTVGIAMTGERWLLLPSLVIVALILIITFLLAKARPEKSTNIGIQVVAIPVAIMLLISFSVFCILGYMNANSPSADSFPLVYEDLDDSAGEIEDTFHISSSSILGQTAYYSMHYENASLSYELYETEHAWILDIIWEYYLSYERNAEAIDCAVLWDTDAAYRNNSGEYYVHIGDTILILDTYKDFELTDAQIAIIRDALGLEG